MQALQPFSVYISPEKVKMQRRNELGSPYLCRATWCVNVSRNIAQSTPRMAVVIVSKIATGHKLKQNPAIIDCIRGREWYCRAAVTHTLHFTGTRFDLPVRVYVFQCIRFCNQPVGDHSVGSWFFSKLWRINPHFCLIITGTIVIEIKIHRKKLF